ncbi:UNVERIFIED_CONTAM: hypothetical protein HDU68_009424 [Siphonaria sp. JEL0065]|nr:hypothetical protein HDU68_009424 [Siphonaria sp. JEL0065]
MPATTLLVIDLQTGMFDGVCFPAIHNSRGLIDATIRVLAHARSSGTPVVFVQHCAAEGPLKKGERGWSVLADFTPLESEIETKVEKEKADSFENTHLLRILADSKIEHLVICGAQSDQCVAATTLSAIEKGFRVSVVSDAHSTWSSDGIDAAEIIDTQNSKFAQAGATLVSSLDLNFLKNA